MVTNITKTVTIYIDDVSYQVPAGANLVDAAKALGNDIPVFCYHPKLAPVGMCRMCLVELGNIEKDRATGQVMLDEKGQPKVRWFPKLQTACTTNVSDGMTVRTNTKQVDEARENVVEFLLTSHPLDCPVCDKGGECPLQNLTMEHGPGASRMNFADKMHLDKHVPLGDLIFLDEERCIQCARCIRFQDEVAGDDVLAFHERGRSLQIITNSEPGFDSYFSGNTTDICPVGALTTADFRFGARPWELTNVPSICPQCPVGCNTTLSTRLDREADGRAIIKRVMPRQNEQVNEIWICDKGRFGHHFSRGADRLQIPLTGNAPASLNRALQVAADKLKAAGSDVAVIAGSSMSNEDLWALKQLANGLGSERLGAWPPTHAGADLVAQVGVGKGTNLSALGKGDAVLIIASDLEEEAPVWRLRINQARKRGAFVVVANARKTQMDEFASETATFEYSEAPNFMVNIEASEIGKKLAAANNLIILTGADGLTLAESRALMQAAANFLIKTGHIGKANNGLMSAFPGSNAMGLHYMGFTPEATLDIAQKPPKVLIVAQSDLIADDPTVGEWLTKVETIISLTLFNDALAGLATVALPIQSFAERDGTFVNGERRVQRFYTAQGPIGESIPAWQAAGRMGELLGQGKMKLSAAAVILDITKSVPAFEGARYKELAHVEPQFPMIQKDVYYGGTAYENTGGLGVQIPTTADKGEALNLGDVFVPDSAKVGKGKMLIVPTSVLYNRERVFQSSELMHPRVADPYAEINSADAKRLNINNGDMVEIAITGAPAIRVRAQVDGGAPKGAIILPRHLTTNAVPLTVTVGSISKVGQVAVVEG
jgi:NADH-quinone oxidoreductase subunit G